MTNWEGKTRGGLTGYKIFVFFIKTFGISFAYLAIYFVAAYFFIFQRKAYRAIFFYFNKRLMYGRMRSFFCVYLNYCMLGRSLVDKVAILSGKRKQYTFDFDGENYLEEIIARGSGGIIINAHIGNWEIAGQLLERINGKINVLMFDAEFRQISSFLKKVMTERNVNNIVIREDMSHLLEIREALSRKEIIAMTGDRYVEGNKVYSIDFLGMKANFPAGPFSIAARFDVPVTFAFAMKGRKLHYHFYATPLKKVEKYRSIPERETVIRNMVEDYAGELERKVRQYPLQWFNYYQFWNIAS